MQNESIHQGEHMVVSSPASENMTFNTDFDEAGQVAYNGQSMASEGEFVNTLEAEGQSFVQSDNNMFMTENNLDENLDFDEFGEATPADQPSLRGVNTKEEAALINAAVASYPEAVTRISEVVIGRDDRRRIRNTKNFPYRAICQLTITGRNGRRYVGTGWLVSPRTIITAGHCVYLQNAGGWAKSIQVTPGMNGNSKPYGSCNATAFRSVTGWVRSKSRDYDYGAIILPPNCKFGSRVGTFNFAAYSDRDLSRKYVNLCGYPGDKGGKTQWYHAKRISRITPKRLIYTIDTAGGQSGSPIFFRMRNGRRVAVGIHTSGSTAGNGGTRINTSVRSNLLRWANEGR